MLVRSEVLELARLMERQPEVFSILDEQERPIATGIDDGSHEWEIIIEALRVAAATLPVPA